MATLAVLVHYDPDGLVANHVRHTITALRPAADRLVFVTTSPLQAEARTALDLPDDVIERDNTGYDFYSWRTGLLATPDWPGYDRIILANDSFVGPLVPLDDLIGNMDAAGADAYGITMSGQQVKHVQSYFLLLNSRAAQHPAIKHFWHGMTPLDDRNEVIQQYELGLGRALCDADLTLASYFTPSPHEERLMAARMASFHRPPALQPFAAAAAYALQPVRQVVESPVLGLWDRVFDDARLPAVKVSLFTRDPYKIDRGAVLARLTDMYSSAFEGFSDYLRRIGVTW